MNGMPGVTRVRSVSGIGLSIVYVEFEWGSRHLPQPPADQRAPEPGARAVAAGHRAAARADLVDHGRDPADRPAHRPGPDRSVRWQVREYADWVMRPRLLTIPGIAQVIPIGGEVRQYRVELKPAQLQALGVEREKLEAALKDFGANTSGGFLEAQGREYLIRQIGRTSAHRGPAQSGGGGAERPADPAETGGRGEAGAGHQARRRRLQRQAGGDPLGAEAARRRQRGADARGRARPGRTGAKSCRGGSRSRSSCSSRPTSSSIR
jgi:hypothetical protein